MVILLLAYHRVNDWSRDALTVRPEEFQWQMNRLAQKYRVICLSELTDLFYRNAVPSENLAAVTFDDGYRDNYLFAYPVLKKMGLGATFFLTAGLVGTRQTLKPGTGRDKDRMLSWEEAAEMAGTGFEFGSHTRTHPRLTGCSSEEARRQIVDSRALLAEKLGRPVELFCYPFGDQSGQIRAMVREAGYAAAVVTPPFRRFIRDIPARLAGQPDVYQLPRVGIYQHTTRNMFRGKTVPLLHNWRVRREDHI